MSPHLLVVPLFVVLVGAGCARDMTPGAVPDFALPTGGGALPLPPAPAPAPPTSPAPPAADAFVEEVAHPYFPLRPGMWWTLEGTAEGAHRRDEVSVLAETRDIGGVACTSVRQEVYLDGTLAERTTEWFAQDDRGNVWKFGEESLEREGAVWVTSDDSWLAGDAGSTAWLFLGADAAVGDVFTDGIDVMEVLAVDRAIVVPFGGFANCLEAIENPDDEEDTDLVIFAPAVGLVSETSPNGRIELTGHGG